LHNQLESVNHDDGRISEAEISIKLKICDILDHFLDLRQNYLQSNILFFFKQVVVTTPYLETKEDKAREVLMLA
jgi:inositol 1,4,5-triphosphate receptor type 1/inositol 1,4,5-triphosphate receptor type 3